MILIDSSVLIDFTGRKVNPCTTWLRQHRYMERFGITTSILCEVLQGMRTERELATARQYLLQLHIFEASSLDMALASVANYRTLRALGITVRSTIDCLTATFCIKEGHTLLHRDRDYDAFEKHLGLRVIHPPTLPLH